MACVSICQRTITLSALSQLFQEIKNKRRLHRLVNTLLNRPLIGERLQCLLISAQTAANEVATINLAFQFVGAPSAFDTLNLVKCTFQRVFDRQKLHEMGIGESIEELISGHYQRIIRLRNRWLCYVPILQLANH